MQAFPAQCALPGFANARVCTCEHWDKNGMSSIAQQCHKVSKENEHALLYMSTAM
jgi:hypothetical protein